MGIPLVDAKARFLRPAKFNDMAEIASEISKFGRGSFEVRHRISIDGELAVEGSETRVWATQDPRRHDPAAGHADPRRSHRPIHGGLVVQQIPDHGTGEAETGWVEFPAARRANSRHLRAYSVDV